MFVKNTFKVVMLGEGRVGKTSLTLRYVYGKFNENQEPSINASCLEKDIEIDGQIEKMAIWDTAGQEMFSGLAPIYYRNAEAAIVVYDITLKETFNHLDKWIKELREHGEENIVIAIAGNKCDKENQRQVSLKEAQEYAKEKGVLHFDTSAKSGKGISEIFNHIAIQTYGRKNPGKKPSKIKIRDSKKNKEEDKSTCC